MNTAMLRRVRRVFPRLPDVPTDVTRHNQRQWVRSVRFLGQRWLLAQPAPRLEQEAPERASTNNWSHE